MISLFSRMMDWAVEQHFRKDASGRCVFLPLVRRGQGYFVDSKADEEKIRAFVKMYRSAALLVVVVGTMGIYAWGWNPMFYAGGNPLKNRLRSLVGSSVIYLVIYLGAALLLWEIYKRAVATFTSSLSEVGPGGAGQLSTVSQRPRSIALVCLFAGLVLAAFGILGATRYKPARPRTQQPAAACPDAPCDEK
jgi:hypothetical protein